MHSPRFISGSIVVAKIVDRSTTAVLLQKLQFDKLDRWTLVRLPVLCEPPHRAPTSNAPRQRDPLAYSCSDGQRFDACQCSSANGTLVNVRLFPRIATYCPRGLRHPQIISVELSRPQPFLTRGSVLRPNSPNIF